ncbi:MAG: ABC-type multidrug transport system fused ATPase/permease subunit [Parasphingorhabdus sp.]|jgi:ABC-type multidrug transport system fused ATPase/permease subunit
MDSSAIQYFDHEHLWLHLVVHLVLVMTPVVLGILVIGSLIRTLRAYLIQKQASLSIDEKEIGSLPRNVLGFITKYSLRTQAILGAGALLTLPVTYAGLELPKQIINNALSAESIGTLTNHTNSNQINLLLILCTLYLLVLIVNGGLKFFLNYYKGKLSERLIRRLRLYIFHRKRGSKDSGNSNIVPVLFLYDRWLSGDRRKTVYWRFGGVTRIL